MKYHWLLFICMISAGLLSPGCLGIDGNSSRNIKNIPARFPELISWAESQGAYDAYGLTVCSAFGNTKFAYICKNNKNVVFAIAQYDFENSEGIKATITWRPKTNAWMYLLASVRSNKFWETDKWAEDSGLDGESCNVMGLNESNQVKRLLVWSPDCEAEKRGTTKARALCRTFDDVVPKVLSLSKELSIYVNHSPVADGICAGSGECRIVSTNGLLREQFTFLDEKMHGKYESWYSNGVKKAKETYKHGELMESLQMHKNGKKAISIVRLGDKYYRIKEWDVNQNLESDLEMLNDDIVKTFK